MQCHPERGEGPKVMAEGNNSGPSAVWMLFFIQNHSIGELGQGGIDTLQMANSVHPVHPCWYLTPAKEPPRIVVAAEA